MVSTQHWSTGDPLFKFNRIHLRIFGHRREADDYPQVSWGVMDPKKKAVTKNKMAYATNRVGQYIRSNTKTY